VTACNNDGVWNETGAGLTFAVLPHFWQTTWFQVLGGLATVVAASGAVWFDTRRRMRRKLERLERQRALEHERARIARDIHDDLGAQLTHITMLSELAWGEIQNPPRAVAYLKRVNHIGRELTRSMDEIVWAVNPKHDTLESLASYLENFALDFLGSAGVRCRLNLPLQFPAWPLSSELRHNVFLAFREALNNAVKHALASEVQLTLTLQDSGFELVIQDNGRGFNPELQNQTAPPPNNRPASGNGLLNMEKRLADVGGSFRLESAPGQGTKITFRVHLPNHAT
jgi:signal transduction histidine kinase